jgi:hypothetical protein
MAQLDMAPELNRKILDHLFFFEVGLREGVPGLGRPYEFLILSP